MYDQSNAQRHTSYSYPQYPATASHKHYPTAHSTSSAFSASANPNEDWTKISDLAERRRIQNRIAQRNYRKKLKKRLEDLERRAGSSSASPELKHEELPQQPDLISLHSNSQRQRSSSNEIARGDTPDVLAQQYVLPSDDRGMFSQQFTRQLSTSPPPFSYASISGSDALSYATYPPAATFCLQSGGGVDMPMYPQYLPVMPQQYQSQGMVSPPIKQEIYGDDEMSPFSMSYASMAGIDVSSGPSYQNFPAAYHTPPLIDSFEQSIAGSPPESTTYPRTPASMPQTPPMSVYDQH